VLGFSAVEVAGQLDTSTAAVNSSLQRARATLAAATPREDLLREPGDRVVRATIERYVHAFESADVDTLITLLTDDAGARDAARPALVRRTCRLRPVSSPAFSRCGAAAGE